MRVLCGLVLLLALIVALDEFGFRGRPWFGWWDANIVVAGPYTLVITPRPGGAAARAGLIDGDLLDLREQSVRARVSLAYQLSATQPTSLRVKRGATIVPVTVLGSSVWENSSFWKLQPFVSRLLTNLVFASCAIALVVAGGPKPQARGLTCLLILLIGTMLDPSFFVVPWVTVSLWCLFISRACATMAAALFVSLDSKSDPTLRRITYVVSAAALAVDLVVVIGLTTGRIDPLPGILSLSAWRSGLDLVMWALVVCTVARRSWLLPLSVACFAYAACFAVPAFIHAWVINVGIVGIANIAVPAGAIITTVLCLQTVNAELRLFLAVGPGR